MTSEASLRFENLSVCLASIVCYHFRPASGRAVALTETM
jgi:hypothetical protein